MDRLRNALGAAGVDGMVILSPEASPGVHVRYLTGFAASSSFLVVGADSAWLITDGRYAEAAAEHLDRSGVALVRQEGTGLHTLAAVVREADMHAVAFEAEHCTVAQFEALESQLPGVKWQPVRGLVEKLRRIKDPEEVEAIRRAARGSGEALKALLPTLAGRTEQAIAADLECRMRDMGLEGPAFATIVASGPRGSLPHAVPSDRIVREGELVTLDFGGVWQGYRSDETVTVAVGAVSPHLREIFDVVYAAYRAAVAAVRPGQPAHAVDRAARTVIEAAGYGAAFLHGTGHGVGLEIHESPFARPAEASEPEDVLACGMTLTVEPGIYLPGTGGVRIEDTLLVTATGAERLTTVDKDWRVL